MLPAHISSRPLPLVQQQKQQQQQQPCHDKNAKNSILFATSATLHHDNDDSSSAMAVSSETEKAVYWVMRSVLCQHFLWKHQQQKQQQQQESETDPSNDNDYCWAGDGVSDELLRHLVLSEDEFTSLKQQTRSMIDTSQSDDSAASLLQVADTTTSASNDDDDEGGNTDNTTAQQQQQPALPSMQNCSWNTKPALGRLCHVLEEWFQTGAVPRRPHENFVVPPGVIEILPAFLAQQQHAGDHKHADAGTTAINGGGAASDHHQKQQQEILTAYQDLRTAALSAASKKRVAGTSPCIHEHPTTDTDAAIGLDSLVRHLLTTLGKPGILYLLGHRMTVGSLDRLCPPTRVLWQSFQKRHKPASRQCLLTVGARALTKHAVRRRRRSTSPAFWPQPTGSETQKNALAQQVLLQTILTEEHAAWINVHVVPTGETNENGEQQQLPVVEIRQENGYGARWSADGSLFRGFLEPVSPFYEGTAAACNGKITTTTTTRATTSAGGTGAAGTAILS